MKRLIKGPLRASKILYGYSGAVMDIINTTPVMDIMHTDAVMDVINTTAHRHAYANVRHAYADMHKDMQLALQA